MGVQLNFRSSSSSIPKSKFLTHPRSQSEIANVSSMGSNSDNIRIFEKTLK